MEIRNATPFPAGLMIRLDADGGECLVVAIRGTWTIAENGSLSTVAVQPPLLAVDEHYGDPALSSIRYEADLGPAKLATDVALVGYAVGPSPEFAEHQVSVTVGPVSQRALVMSDRNAANPSLGGGDGATAPAGYVPLMWELASGGSDTTPDDPRFHGVERRNPVGRGFRAKHSKRPAAPVPQIVALDGDAPTGFGFIGPHWLPRSLFAGTYGEAWRNDRCPLLPDDFDPRFFNSAAPALIAPGHLVGGEAVEVRGCTPSGLMAFALPYVPVGAEATVAGRAEPVPLQLATVTIDTDRMQLRLSWRGELNIHRRVPRLEHVDVSIAEAAA